MIDQPSRLLLFMKDFTGRGADSFYWFQDGRLQETEANSVVEFPGIVICHDFWMIRDALFDRTGTLPGKIIDVDEFRISISGIPEDRLAREKRDVTTQIGQYGAEQEVRNTYQKMFNKGVPFDAAVVAKAAAAISAMYADLCAQASANGEFDRFFSVEVPAYRLLQLSMSSGVLIDTSGLSNKRAQAEHDYFLLLKDYSAKHDMPLETPTRRAIEAKLLKEGFVLDEVSVEYLLEFVPHERDFGSDTMALLALDTARRVLGVRRQRLWHRSGVADNGGIGSRRSDVRNADETQSLQPKIGCQAHQEARRGGGERYSPCHTPAFLGRG